MSGKGCKVNTGDLSGQIGVHAAKQPKNRPTGVRAVIVATKSGNADGAKDGRKRKWHLKENPHEKRLSITQEVRTNAALVWRDISLWTVIEKINANRDCTLGLLMVSPAQRVGAYV